MSEKYRRMLCRQEGERLRGIVDTQRNARVSAGGPTNEDVKALETKQMELVAKIAETNKTVAALSDKVDAVK
jgi:hypothetical protein